MINSDWKKNVPEDFSGDSRVWVYQSNRPFTEAEGERIRHQLAVYVAGWMSHNRPVKGWGTVIFDQFIVLMADDTMDRLCGSAVDASIRFVKDLEAQYGLMLMNRMNMGFVKEGALLTFPLQDVERKVLDKTITGETLFFNNAITTKYQLLDDWILPFEKSFLWKRIKVETIVE